MKRTLLAATAALLSLAGCGWYTNIPAQIAVHSIKPGRVTYQPPNASGVRLVEIEAPVVTFQGEPGSIGVNFTEMSVRYLNTALGATGAKLPALKMGFTFRVESSTYATQPNTGRMTQAEQGTVIEVGKREIEFPIVTRHVEQFGLEDQAPEGNASMVTADCTLIGADDANLPVTLNVQIPIYFSGDPRIR